MQHQGDMKRIRVLGVGIRTPEQGIVCTCSRVYLVPNLHRLGKDDSKRTLNLELSAGFRDQVSGKFSREQYASICLLASDNLKTRQDLS